jgi:hypothetical protein
MRRLIQGILVLAAFEMIGLPSPAKADVVDLRFCHSSESGLGDQLPLDSQAADARITEIYSVVLPNASSLFEAGFLYRTKADRVFIQLNSIGLPLFAHWAKEQSAESTVPTQPRAYFDLTASRDTVEKMFLSGILSRCLPR